MSAAIGLRLDFGAAELCTLAGRTKNAGQARRRLAHATVYDGKPARGRSPRWHCLDLRRELSYRFGVDLSEVSLGRQLKQLGFSHISTRPLHPAQPPEKFTALKKASATWLPGS